MALEFELIYTGADADTGLIDFYDASRALVGFQRSLALTTHLVINNEIITQAPHVSGFKILAPPFEDGSWRSRAVIIFTTAVALTSAGRDSPLGQVITSVYDAVLSNTMGFHVDYDKTLQEQYYENLKGEQITPEKIDSLCEKVEANIADMHRPLIVSKTAKKANVLAGDEGRRKLGPDFSLATYEYVKQTVRSKDNGLISGYVSSYNINTFTGRLYCDAESRPIPFELDEEARTQPIIGAITRSQHFNGQLRFDPRALVHLHADKLLSSTGRVKRYLVTGVETI